MTFDRAPQKRKKEKKPQTLEESIKEKIDLFISRNPNYKKVTFSSGEINTLFNDITQGKPVNVPSDIALIYSKMKEAQINFNFSVENFRFLSNIFKALGKTENVLALLNGLEKGNVNIAESLFAPENFIFIISKCVDIEKPVDIRDFLVKIGNLEISKIGEAEIINVFTEILSSLTNPHPDPVHETTLKNFLINLKIFFADPENIEFAHKSEQMLNFKLELLRANILLKNCKIVNEICANIIAQGTNFLNNSEYIEHFFVSLFLGKRTSLTLQDYYSVLIDACLVKIVESINYVRQQDQNIEIEDLDSEKVFENAEKMASKIKLPKVDEIKSQGPNLATTNYADLNRRTPVNDLANKTTNYALNPSGKKPKGGK